MSTTLSAVPDFSEDDRNMVVSVVRVFVNARKMQNSSTYGLRNSGVLLQLTKF